MDKDTADDASKADWPLPPSSSNYPVSSPTSRKTEDTGAPSNNGTSTGTADDKMEGKFERPTSPASTNPWSTSATLPVSPESEIKHASSGTGTGIRIVSEDEETSPTPWSTSATLPVTPEPVSNEAPAAAEAAATPPVEEKKKKFSKAEYSVAFKHFIRIFSYSTWGDRFLLLAASLCSICTGVTLPLMNIVFGISKLPSKLSSEAYKVVGQLVGAFSAHYNPWSGETEQMFTATINKNV